MYDIFCTVYLNVFVVLKYREDKCSDHEIE